MSYQSELSYPLHGITSVGAYFVSNKEDLLALVEYLEGLSYLTAAEEIRKQHPSEFPEKVYTLELTQSEINKISLLFGHVVNGYSIIEKVDHLVSQDIIDEFGINYNLVDYRVDSDGLQIEILGV